MKMRTNVADVYIARIPNELEVKRLSSDERNAYVEKTGNPAAKREKYFAWRLLEYALRKSLGIEISDLKFEKTASGRWITEGVEFSISHSESAVAVAISDSPVGVDIEEIKKPRSERFAKRILSLDELSVCETLNGYEKDEYLLGKWTAKEAVFKSRNLDFFHPTEPISDEENVITDTVSLDGKIYVYSVSSHSIGKLRVFADLSAEEVIN